MVNCELRGRSCIMNYDLCIDMKKVLINFEA